jgi:hypothetical protein
LKFETLLLISMVILYLLKRKTEGAESGQTGDFFFRQDLI